MKNFFTIILMLSTFSLFGNNTIVLSDSTKIDSTKEVEIFDRTEVMPRFPGGPEQMMKYLSKNIKYPELARKNGLQGKVVIKFYIDVDGTVKEPVVLKDGVGGGCAEEAMRVISMMPKWSPGTQRGKAVKVYYVLPVTFKFSSDEDVTDNPTQDALYPGGNVQLEFYKQDVLKNIKKSKQEKNKKITVKVSVIIDDLGKVSNPVVVGSNTTDKKNIAIILDGVKNMPNWLPAMHNKKTIAVSKIITFEY